MTLSTALQNKTITQLRNDTKYCITKQDPSTKPNAYGSSDL